MFYYFDNGVKRFIKLLQRIALLILLKVEINVHAFKSIIHVPGGLIKMAWCNIYNMKSLFLKKDLLNRVGVES